MDKPRALVVEDEGSLADIYSEALRAAGFETEVIMGGLTAIMRVAADAPDLIVLDLHLPNISGADILRQIRANERMANTYVIVATADPVMAETVREEANVVLLKPVSFKQLRDMATRFRLSHAQTGPLGPASR